jgi:hypothetical protein
VISKIKEIKEVLIDKKRDWSQKRSKDWPKVRQAHLKEFPVCAVCGCNVDVEVHHIKPFHIAPELELEPSNLISLCETKKYGVNCHLFFGHLGNYKTENLHLLEDVKRWQKRFEERKKQLKD